MRTNQGPLREGMCVREVERGLVDDIQPEPWQNDRTVSGWLYKPNTPVWPVNAIVDLLADLVSANGNVLLYAPPPWVQGDDALGGMTPAEQPCAHAVWLWR